MLSVAALVEKGVRHMRSAGGQGTHRNARRIEDMFTITIGYIIKRKLLTPGALEYWPVEQPYTTGADTVAWLAQDGYSQLHFFRDGERIAEPQRIEFTRSRFRNSPHHRVYFQGCATCSRRCGKLYIFEDETVAKCRQCHGALHATTSMKAHDRAAYLAYKIRLRLDPDADWLAASDRALAASMGFTVLPPVFPPRPKFMKGYKYEQLRDEHDKRLRGIPIATRRPDCTKQRVEQRFRAGQLDRNARVERDLAASDAAERAAVERDHDRTHRTAIARRRQAEADSWPIDPRG